MVITVEGYSQEERWGNTLGVGLQQLYVCFLSFYGYFTRMNTVKKNPCKITVNYLQLQLLVVYHNKCSICKVTSVFLQ